MPSGTDVEVQPVTAVNDHQGPSTCREVLLRNIDKPQYSGDYSHLLTQQSIEEALADAHIKQQCLSVYIASLKSVQNVLVPINKLPVEILAVIFELCMPSPLAGYTPSALNRRDLAFSQVCGRWRRLAIDTAVLWTCPDFARPRLATMMLKRAGSAPLNVNIEDIQLRPIMHDLKPTIKTFALTDKTSSLDAADISAYLSSHYPILESISLRGSGFGTGPISSPAVDLKGFHAPRLQSLEISWFIITNAAPFKDLVNLDLDYISRVSGHLDADASTELMVFLGGSPRLQTLRLYDVMSSGAFRPPPQNSSNSLTLSQLKRFVIRDDVNCLMRLLPRLYFPGLTNIDMRGSMYDADDAHTPQNLRASHELLTTILRNAQWAQVRFTEVTWGIYCDNELDLQASSDTSEHHIRFCIEDIPFELSIAGLDTFSSSIISTIPSAHIMQCQVIDLNPESNVGIMIDFWDTLAAWPKLETVVLRGEVGGPPANATAHLLASLLGQSQDRFGLPSTSSTAHPFPALKVLKLNTLSVSDEEWPGHFSFLPALVAIQRDRADTLEMHLSKCLFMLSRELDPPPAGFIVEYPRFQDLEKVAGSDSDGSEESIDDEESLHSLW